MNEARQYCKINLNVYSVISILIDDINIIKSYMSDIRRMNF